MTTNIALFDLDLFELKNQLLVDDKILDDKLKQLEYERAKLYSQYICAQSKNIHFIQSV